LNLVVLDPKLVQEGATYKVQFTSGGTFPVYKTTGYKLTRTINGKEDVIFAKVDSSQFSKGQFSAPFDGLVLSVKADTMGALKTKGFVKGFSNIDVIVAPDKSSPTRNVAWPADYEIEWLPDGQTYTTPFQKFVAPIKARNITEGRDVDLEVFDNDKDGKLTMGDDIVIIEYVNNQFRLTWRIQLRIPAAAMWTGPKPGDIFRFTTSRPFKEGDYFEFSTKGAQIDQELAKNSLSKIAVVPNPYICANAWEKRNLNQTGRGERRLDFIHLPVKCTIRIYTIAGQLIKTLEKTNGAEDGTVTWNLISDDGTDLAYGLYIYHVDAPGIGEYIGKFAIIK
jgi:hypothetical protein